MEEYNTEVLEAALKTIREECKKYNRCQHCPLRISFKPGSYECYTRNINPDKWLLSSDDGVAPRLLV